QAALHSLRRAHDRPRPGDGGGDRPADPADPGARGDRGDRHPRHAERVHGRGPRGHAARGHDPAGGNRGRDPGHHRSGRAAVHRGPARRRRRRRDGRAEVAVMKRGNEFLVGLVVLASLALVIGGALWLSEHDIRQKNDVYVARFRTVGGLGVGAPVTLRGVRVGRVEAIRLARDEWVEAELTVDKRVVLPRKPAVISSSSSLFGEWTANIIPFEPLPDDPNVRAALIESDLTGGDAWPGATLPDIGQLTAQASRIAGDVADVTQRIRGVFDSSALRDLKQSVVDLAAISNRLVRF